jgi:hypothetical protein
MKDRSWESERGSAPENRVILTIRPEAPKKEGTAKP